MLDAFDPYIDVNASPGFEHRGDTTPIESFYKVPADPDAPRTCCLRAMLTERHEFTCQTFCSEHGQRSVGNTD